MNINELNIKRPFKRDPDLAYDDEGKTKKDTAAGIIDKVTVYLTGKKSEVYTKLSKRYAEIDEIEKKINKEKAELNTQLTGEIEALFPTSDDIHTRIVDTVSLVAKLAKAEQAGTISSFNANGFIDELADMFPELNDAMDQLRSKYTVIKNVAAKKSKLLKPKVKLDKATDAEKSAFTESAIGDKVMSYARNAYNYIDELFTQWDGKFNNLQSRVDTAIAA